MSNISSRISPNKLRRYLNPRYLKSPIVTGTFFLTGAGIITKFIGFFYRIFLSRVFSEESLGIFGLTAPVMMLVHSVCAAGIQNAITRYVASSKKAGHPRHIRTFLPAWLFPFFSQAPWLTLFLTTHLILPSI